MTASQNPTTDPSAIQEYSINPIVKEIGKINFEGNITPHNWYKHVKLPSGKVDFIGITILAEIIYWYRPVKVLNNDQQEQTRQKFKGDKAQLSRQFFMNKFGITRDQSIDALKRLSDRGYIDREYRTVRTKQGAVLYDVLYVEPVIEEILRITFEEEATPEDLSATPSDLSDTPSDLSDTPSDLSEHTKITTKITTKTTTKNTTLLEKVDNFSGNTTAGNKYEDEAEAVQKAIEWAKQDDFWKTRFSKESVRKWLKDEDSAFYTQFNANQKKDSIRFIVTLGIEKLRPMTQAFIARDMTQAKEIAMEIARINNLQDGETLSITNTESREEINIKYNR